MKKVNILTKGFDSPNGCAFLFPLIKYQRGLCNQGIDIKLHTTIKKSLYDCDILMVESKYFSSHWELSADKVLELFEKFRKKISKVIYCDISDSSGFPHARVLPYVHAYVKNQLLADKNLYLKPLYAHRLYSDYYHKHYGVNDKNPLYSEPIKNTALLKKLTVGWNSGLANYSLFGPYRMLCYRKLRVPSLLAYPQKYTQVTNFRKHTLSCRMGIGYARDSVAWQRRKIRDKLTSFVLTDKLSRQRYYRELQTSKFVISPFGLGEITLKDFEVFLTGGLLIKPDMCHMETWPDFFRKHETMISFDWDLNALGEHINELIINYSNLIEIAQAGQAYYRKFLCGDNAEQMFCDHLMGIIKSC